MNKIDYQALREVAQNYQSTLAWYEAIPDSPHAEADCDRALAAFKRQIRHQEMDIIADLLDELEATKKRIAELEAREIKPAKGEVLVVVSGFTGCGKSAIAGEIEIAMKAIGVPVQWTNGDAEKRMTGADWLTAIEMYKPTVRIVEVNVPRVPGIRIKGGE